MSEFLQFADEPEGKEIQTDNLRYWKILVVDDEEDIHGITRLVMDNFEFLGRKLLFIDAYSGKEAEQIIRENNDIAVILLDVVMETSTAGLDLVRVIREELGNKMTRIILRTGQPGSAPEKDIIINYDINDYKHKTELTKSKLDTTIISAVRAYSDLTVLNKSRKGLRKIIDASADLFEMNSMRKFIEGILLQLTSLLRLEDSTLFLETSAVAIDDSQEEMKIIAATGKYTDLVDKSLKESIPEDLLQLVRQSINERESIFEGPYYIGFFQSAKDRHNILLLEGFYDLEPTDRYLIELFSRNINIAFENHFRNQDSIDTRDEILFKLGEVTERHKFRNTHHVQRVGEIAFRLAELMGKNHEEAEEIKIAAAMHDVGKILLNDNILEKQAPLSEEELEEMRYHTEIGEFILHNNRFKLLENAAEVAAQHHERWDGTGYPKQLKEEEISLPARIASLAMIYDVLNYDQPYRKAWKEEDVLAFIEDNSGRIFDPQLTSLFLKNYSYIKEVKKIYPD